MPIVRAFALFTLSLGLFASCAKRISVPSSPKIHSSFLTTSDGKNLPLRHWNLQSQPETIILGLPGIDGAARDFKSLGKDLPKETSLFALNLRGLGYDPNPKQRGEISSASFWLRDLSEFHHTLKQRYPKAKVIWLGESMGSLIALHAASDSGVQPDALIMSSPPVSLDLVPFSQRLLLRIAASVLPAYRLPLTAITQDSFQTTSKSTHGQQAAKNAWHVEAYTLRFLNEVAKLSQQATTKARKVDLPVFILHGGLDPIAPAGVLKEFAQEFPQPARVQEFPQSRHLLFYDKDRRKVGSSLLEWVGQRKRLSEWTESLRN